MIGIIFVCINICSHTHTQLPLLSVPGICSFFNYTSYNFRIYNAYQVYKHTKFKIHYKGDTTVLL